ncbi:MAG: hypothetical protein ABR957_03030 [Terracidiphilus sp.]
MLRPMQQSATSQPSPSVSSFAGLLATLASPPPSLPSGSAAEASLWNSSDLGEDVATLSYEHALRAHARYRPADRNSDRVGRADRAPMPMGDSGSDASAEAAIEIDAAGTTAEANAAPGRKFGTAPNPNLRSASVTIRLNRAECARLHRRAAEAGLTVSAYLRSCALEAEALRAQVKQALTELKAGIERPSHASGETAVVPGRDRGSKKSGWRNFFGWIRCFTRRGR